MDELYHVVNALIPVAGAFTGTVNTVPINLKNYQHVSFLMVCGAGAVGTATITVEACDDAVPTNKTAIPFFYQECVATDIFGAVIKTADATGFLTSAAANKMYKIEVDDQMLAGTGFGYVRIKSVESTVGAVTGCIVAVLTEGRYQSETVPTALV